MIDLSGRPIVGRIRFDDGDISPLDHPAPCLREQGRAKVNKFHPSQVRNLRVIVFSVAFGTGPKLDDSLTRPDHQLLDELSPAFQQTLAEPIIVCAACGA